ncbi:hypothetical protein DWB85_06435 [Seongchinamella sediminis]|uniref:Uncharacterized protein n=1 Tax=Seongchinamella sediminis TaxID=2283635 RepID=A0A3L7DZF9_9GAMM|nr:hypothetical protein [Seongchinamella sediminis]RLQ22616.1 hypothetical protein DWB85_06435 [Seongchinamella sediminis]
MINREVSDECPFPDWSVEPRIHIQREKDLAEIPLLRITNASTTEEKLAAIVERFTNLGYARPRKVVCAFTE